jgi:hypothetical protein
LGPSGKLLFGPKARPIPAWGIALRTDASGIKGLKRVLKKSVSLKGTALAVP